MPSIVELPLYAWPSAVWQIIYMVMLPYLHPALVKTYSLFEVRGWKPWLLWNILYKSNYEVFGCVGRLSHGCHTLGRDAESTVAQRDLTPHGHTLRRLAPPRLIICALWLAHTRARGNSRAGLRCHCSDIWWLMYR